MLNIEIRIMIYTFFTIVSRIVIWHPLLGQLSNIIKYLQLIWRSGTRRSNLWIPDLQVSCRDLQRYNRVISHNNDSQGGMPQLKLACRYGCHIPSSCTTGVNSPSGIKGSVSQLTSEEGKKRHDYHSLPWRYHELAGVSNHQPHGCLLNRLFTRRSKKTSKLRVTGLCVGNSPGAGEFPAQRASNAENVSIWWRHHTDSNNGSSHIWHQAMGLNQCQRIVDWSIGNKFQWNLYQNTIISFRKTAVIRART